MIGKEIALSLSKDAIINAVVDCLGRIPFYTDVYGYESCTMRSDCEVSVILCGGQHDPWGRYPDAYSFKLRSCLCLALYGDSTEETLRQLWAMQMEVFGPPYSQDGYTIVWNLSQFSTSYADVSGICCRIMDSWLSCEIGGRASGWQREWCGGLNGWRRTGCLSCGGPRDWASYGIG